MKLGLIGHPLGHSWSNLIHKRMIGEDYKMWDIEDIDSFMNKKNFDGINVTIPYKERVIPYLDEIDELAKRIGAINCIKNDHGKLIGYNTDALGFKQVLINNKIDIKDKKIAILGSGGVSKAIYEVVKQDSNDIVIVSRTKKNNCITYEELDIGSIQVLINATPIGMYPKVDECIIDLDGFDNLEVVIDVVANPICTKLMFEAKKRNIKAYGGLEMLVRQAYCADEIFLDKKLDVCLVDDCLKYLKKTMCNIVFIGMPTSGKSTISKELGLRLNKEVEEMDELIEKKIGCTISEFFKEKGEEEFRKVEREVAKELLNKKGVIISSGGGVVTQERTMQYLKMNSIVIWLKRNLDKLFSSEDRPLTGDETYMKNLYNQRKDLYKKYADIEIENNESIPLTIEDILIKIGEL